MSDNRARWGGRAAWTGTGLQAAILAVCLAGWWGRPVYTLLNHPHWIAGKDTGKFLFYTFEFMLAPLSGNTVELHRDMAFQEVLFAPPLGGSRRLEEVRCGARIDPGAYLWILLEKQGHHPASAIRLSRHRRYASGYYEFDEDGRRRRFEPLDAAAAWARDGWMDVRVARDGDGWTAQAGGSGLGQWSASLTPAGNGAVRRTGFRGSGSTRREVAVRDVEYRFSDPSNPDRRWTEPAPFCPPEIALTGGAGAAACAGLVILLRFGSRRVLAGVLPAQVRSRFLSTDAAGSLAALTVAAAAVGRHHGSLIVPTWLVLAEAAGAVAWAVALRAGQGHGATTSVRGAWPLLAVWAVLLAACGSFDAPNRDRLDADVGSLPPKLPASAVDVHPPPAPGGGPFELPAPAMLRPADPLWAPGARRTQRIEARLTLPPDATVDLAVCQQSFRTRGDPDGELLPLQRRLIRLSTQPGVPWGLASRTDLRPAPFRPLRGELRPEVPVALNVRHDGGGLEVSLNGTTTRFGGLRPLGAGETGWMSLRGAVRIDRWSVAPVDDAVRAPDGWRAPAAWILPLHLGLAWLLGAAAGPPRARHRFALAAATFFPLGVAAALPATAALAGHPLPDDARGVWWALAVATWAVSHLHPVIAAPRRSVGRVAVANGLITAALAGLAVAGWFGLLPREHPLRIRWSRDAVAPAGDPGKQAPANPSRLPWFARNDLIGSNTFAWRQQFGGKSWAADPRGAPRVLVAGGSQAWGSGAASSHATFAALLEQRLRQSGIPVDVYNAGVNGAGLRQIYHYYTELWSGLDPDLLVLDVGLNDTASTRMLPREDQRQRRMRALADILRALLGACRRDGVEVILVLEPMSRESSLEPMPDLYHALSEVARQHQAAVIDPAATFEQSERDHFVWWDTAHLTPFGHQLMAELIAPAVAQAVGAGTDATPIVEANEMNQRGDSLRQGPDKN